ncbi:peptidoglycan D,D-transpeptidase FtsI family protein, partial [Magnetococcales bacterium HHB-1]
MFFSPRKTASSTPRKKRVAQPRSTPQHRFFTPPPRAFPPFPENRIEIIIGLFLLGFVILALRAMDLTLLQGEVLQNKAKNQHKKRIPIRAHRGQIFDRQGRTLAVSLPVTTLSLDRDRLKSTPFELAQRLAPILKIPREKLHTRISKAKAGSFPELKRKLPPDVVKQIKDLKEPSLFFLPSAQRFYPMGEIFGPVLGFINYEGKGVEGLERAFDETLQGEDGERMITRDRLGRPLMPGSREIRPAHPGADITLTIDSTIQYIAYRALLKSVKAYDAKSGVAVIMEPKTSRVLALVNVPSFNPNNLGTSKPEERRNRVTMDTYEPGSTFKIFTVAAALDLGLINPHT